MNLNEAITSLSSDLLIRDQLTTIDSLKHSQFMSSAVKWSDREFLKDIINRFLTVDININIKVAQETLTILFSKGSKQFFEIKAIYLNRQVAFFDASENRLIFTKETSSMTNPSELEEIFLNFICAIKNRNNLKLINQAISNNDLPDAL